MLSQNSPAKVVCPKVLGFSDMAAADIAGTSGLIGCFAFKLTSFSTSGLGFASTTHPLANPQSRSSGLAVRP